MKNTMKKILFLALALIASNGNAALNEVDKSLYSERNLLINPGFENGKNSWLSSSATLTATTTAANVLYGTASGSILISSNGGYVRSKTVAVPTALYGQACEARVLYKGGDALTTLEVYNRDNTLLGSLALTAQTNPGYQSVFFMCPTLAQVTGDADTGFLYTQIKQTSAGTHTVLYSDSWYMGQLLNLGEATLPDLFSAKISSTGVVSSENNDFFNGNCSVASTNEFTCNFVSSLFSVAPICVATSETVTATNGVMVVVNSISSSSVVFETVRHDANATATDMHVHCQKGGADAKQSVQVYKSIPKVANNINEFSAKVSSADAVSDENTDWINGNCTNATAGRATCLFTAGTFSVTPNCSATINSTVVNQSCGIVAASTDSTQVQVTCRNTNTSTEVDTAFNLSCQKAGSDFKMPVVQPIFAPTGLAGTVVNSAYFETGAVATGTTIIPTDDTIPQNTEGTEFMTLAYTPRSATNLLKITVVGNFSNSASVVCNMALFQDSNANAVASTLTSIVGANGENMKLIHYQVAGSTASTTFKMRAGCGGAGTMTFNGVGGGRYYGGTMASSITIEEIAQ